MNHDQREIKLVLPNDMKCLPSLLAAARAFATSLGFSEPDTKSIELGLEEAAGNVIRHAFRAEERETFEVVLKPIKFGLEITIDEMGIPWDPESLPACESEDCLPDPAKVRFGLRLIRQAMDQVSFKNLGYRGNETRLVKYVSSQRVDEQMPGLERADDKVASREERPPVSFLVRPMKPSEALEVSRCAYTSYGYSYVNENIYFPERVREMNSEGKLLSFVAVTEVGGKIIGHIALEPPGDTQGLVEMGVAFVKPEYRRMGVMEKLGALAITEAERRGFSGLFVIAVCTHPYSQKGAHKLGLRDCSLLLSRASAPHFKEIEQTAHDRESVLLALMPLRPVPARKLFAPPQHLDILKKLYANLGLTPTFGRDESGPSMVLGDCSINVSTDSMHCARIDVKRYGQNTEHTVRKALKTLCLGRIETVYLHLNLCDPATSWMTEKFESMGFFFSGILPGAATSDVLILQYLNNATVDYGALRFASDIATELACYVMERDPNRAISDGVVMSRL